MFSPLLGRGKVPSPTVADRITGKASAKYVANRRKVEMPQRFKLYKLKLEPMLHNTYQRL